MGSKEQAYGRYVLEDRIAMGGMAEIFRARTNTEGFQKQICIKRILPNFIHEAGFEAMFRDEAALAALNRHGDLNLDPVRGGESVIQLVVARLHSSRRWVRDLEWCCICRGVAVATSGHLVLHEPGGLRYVSPARGCRVVL